MQLMDAVLDPANKERSAAAKKALEASDAFKQHLDRVIALSDRGQMSQDEQVTLFLAVRYTEGSWEMVRSALDGKVKLNPTSTIRYARSRTTYCELLPAEHERQTAV